ncbi:hypothetical protein GCM10025875_18690 [Litorihabitans aurantiacus]|uniref:Transcriptional regulator LacI/GalR-like sensor domain-containing protein n=2 Tax=Litorihabitans aurantiacus TaxID=1930061 RepID=A0AA37XEU4_9MICO|nr:hypothetical protein GCM10025875_18690 [Litorihabitans aurantiacus]
MVLLGERGSESGAAGTDHVSVANVAGAAEATAHLLARGRRRPAFLGAQPDAPPGTALLRQRGFERALDEAGLPSRPGWLLATPHYTRRAGADAVEAVLARLGEVDAVVCGNDDLALGVMHAFRRNGVRVPDDVAVVGWDNTEAGRYAAPTLSTVAPDLDALAVLAVDRLIARVQGDTSAAEHHTIAHRLLVRESSDVRG